MLRVLAWVLIGSAVVAGVGDFIATQGQGFRLRAVGEWWARFDRESLLLLQPAIERHVARWLWDPVMLTILTMPAFSFLLALGAATLLLSFIRR